MRPIRLEELRPPTPPDPDDLAPPPRFADTTLAGYEPQDASQAAARERVRGFVAEAGRAAAARRRWWRPSPPGRGLYLDGGFGVGKTHLLAAAFAAADVTPKRYLSFQELVYLIGVRGAGTARATLGAARLLCVDEFELDDPGNTLLVKSFLGPAMDGGCHVITTSNTEPSAQGRGRFNAEDFRREIQSLAERFEVLTVGGPDYRQRGRLAELLPAARLRDLERHEPAPAPRVAATWDELLELLRRVHPSRFGSLLAQMGTLYLEGVRTVALQHDALRVVHFVDKLYDAGVALRASGAMPLRELFHPSYADSAYAKKHQRCLSRLSELLAEAPASGAERRRVGATVPSGSAVGGEAGGTP